MNIGGYKFEGPFDCDLGFKNAISAVYAVLSGDNRVLDVGQTDDLNNRFPGRDREECWKRNATNGYRLFILKVPAVATRLAIESALRQKYAPACGVR